jgi:hypothetical protein
VGRKRCVDGAGDESIHATFTDETRNKYSVQGNSAPVPAMLSMCSSKVCRSYLSVLSDDIDCEPREINRELQPPSGTSNRAQRRRAEDSAALSEVGCCPICVHYTFSVRQTHRGLFSGIMLHLSLKVSVKWHHDGHNKSLLEQLEL